MEHLCSQRYNPLRLALLLATLCIAPTLVPSDFSPVLYRGRHLKRSAINLPPPYVLFRLRVHPDHLQMHALWHNQA